MSGFSFRNPGFTSILTPSINTGPGPQTLIAGDMTTGFFGQTTQAEFGRTMTQVMSDLGITQGFLRNEFSNLLKFIHNGKIKFINIRNIRNAISWDHIQARLTQSGGQGVYGGRTLTFGGHSYRVRLMRGWGVVFANTNGTGTPNYETGPLFTNGGSINWPQSNSPWNPLSPNEWNTLFFPIHVDGKSQSQTTGVPNWANFSAIDLNIADGFGASSSWMQENLYIPPGSFNYYPRNLNRTRSFSDSVAGFDFDQSSSTSSQQSLRLVFELIT